MKRLDRYEIRGVIGKGSMGVVYDAFDSVLERRVAIKTSNAPRDPGLQRRFLREMKAASRISHPNIVTVYDGGFDGDRGFLAMEIVEGSSLQELIDQRGSLAPNEALAILKPLAEALACAHRSGVVHSDLKPANILIGRGGQPKILDFGVATLLDVEATTTMLVGTPSHMAPEQIRGKRIDGRADVFSLAIVAYRLLTGQRPFAGEQVAVVLNNILHDEHLPPGRLNQDFGTQVDAVFARAFAKDPERRTPDPITFVCELEGALQSARMPKARPAPFRPFSPRRRSRWESRIAAAVAAGSFSLVVLFASPEGVSRLLKNSPSRRLVQ